MNNLAGFKKLTAAAMVAAAFGLAAPAAHAIFITIAVDVPIVDGGANTTGTFIATTAYTGNSDGTLPDNFPGTLNAEGHLKFIAADNFTALGLCGLTGGAICSVASAGGSLVSAVWQLYGTFAAYTPNATSSFDTVAHLGGPGSAPGVNAKTDFKITEASDAFPQVTASAVLSTWTLAGGSGDLPGVSGDAFRIVAGTTADAVNGTTNACAGAASAGVCEIAPAASPGAVDPLEHFANGNLSELKTGTTYLVDSILAGDFSFNTADGGAVAAGYEDTSTLTAGNKAGDATLRVYYTYEYTPTAAPLPATPLLLAGGLALLGFMRRRVSA